ncbi:phage tail tape measure protein [Streptomyces sp. NPDC087851]|uniref:phage tail tape measure protein n=1 Tax=Streptomyces sp. NPDC087851 TaxID=3365810 RepID=UPI00380E07E7
MAVRTVRVVLTGTVTPYTSAMRTAARTTAATAGQINTTMRQTSTRVQASMTAMARSTQAQALRAGASVRTMAVRAGADMSRMAARTQAAMRAALAPIPGYVARAGAAFGQLAARGTAALRAVQTSGVRAGQTVAGAFTAAGVRASASLRALQGRAALTYGAITRSASRAAVATAARWTAATSLVSAQFPRLSAAAAAGGARMAAGLNAGAATVAARWNAAMTAAGAGMGRLRVVAALTSAGVANRWSVASAVVAARWAAAGAAIAGVTAGVRAGAGTAAGWVGARWSAASAIVAARWAAASTVVTGAMAGARAGAGTAAGWVAARWSAAAAAVSARWSATGAAVTGAMAGARTAAGAAAGAMAARWSAAAAAVGRAFGAMRLAAFAAGAGVMAVATGGRRALEAARTASLGLVGVFALAAVAAAKFEKAMSEVRAVTNGSAGDMKALSQAALDAGQATKYSASQAANAEAELARAGVSTADIIGGALKGSLDLAASGQLELGESAIISAQAMNAFKLEGKDVGHIADVISAGAGKSATNVHDMGMAFRQGALLASQTGLSLEDTVGSLSLFAQNALTGSDAGTSLKVMLQRLVPQSKEAAAAMDAIGFSAYDSQGNFIGLSALADNMKTSFSKLTPEARNAAMATIFGSDAVRAATILYEAGAAGVDSWVGAVNDSGYATRVAATMTDNLAGDLERLKSALETALIGSGSAANQVLRDMAQVLTRVVNWYTQLSPSMQSTVTTTAGLVGVVGLLGAGLLLVLPRIMTVRRELVALGLTAARTRAAMSMMGRLGLVVGGIAAVSWATGKLTEKLKDAPPNVTKMTNALVDLAAKGKATGELSKTFGEDLDGIGKAAARLAHPGTLDRIGDSLYSITHLGQSDDAGLEEARDKLKGLDEALASLVQSGASDVAADSFKRFAAEAEKGGTSTEKFKTLLPGYTEALSAADTQSKLAAGSQGELGDAASMTADDMADQRTEAEKLTDALKILNGASISAAEGEIGFRSSLADLNETVKDNGHSLDVTTEKGRAVKSAFLDAAKAAMAHAEAVSEQTGTIESGQAVLEQDIAILKRSMQQAGFSEDAIRELTDSYAKLPTTAQTTVTSPGARKAAEELAVLREKVMAVPPGKSITVRAPTGAAIKALQAAGYNVKRIPGSKDVRITAPTGTPVANAQALKRALDALQSRTVTVTTRYVVVGDGSAARKAGSHGSQLKNARGGLIRRYAEGGQVVQVYPNGGAIRGPGTGTSDSIPSLVSNGEYVVKAAAVRKYGINMFDRLNAMRFASGGAVGFTYTPTAAPALGGTTDPRERFDQLVQRLREAWADLSKAMADQKKKADALRKAEANLAKVRKSKPTKKQLEAAQDKVADARKAKKSADAKVSSERKDVQAANAALGQSPNAKAPTQLNLAGYQKQLNASLAATEKWRGNLAKIGRRGGAEVQAMLEAMGEGGYSLVNALAGASDKQFKDITSKLLKTGEVAKASLADFTKQIGAATKTNTQFAADLQQLAGMGYGDLAQALAAQGDSAAQALARQAVTGGAAGAAQANAAVKANQAALSGEDLANALVLLSTLRAAPGRGYAELLAAGLDTGVIRALVPRMMAQINALPAANKGKFLQQFAGQTGVTAMARGGILTRPTVVLGGEAGDTEGWIPINGSARSRALLEETGRLMGYRMTPASRYGAAPAGARQVIREGDRIANVTLNGAKQTSAEQAMDVARHMQLIG